jgi:hypothetical protein
VEPVIGRAFARPIADLFILRPTAMFLINLSERIRGTADHAKPGEESGAGS